MAGQCPSHVPNFTEIEADLRAAHHLLSSFDIDVQIVRAGARLEGPLLTLFRDNLRSAAEIHERLTVQRPMLTRFLRPTLAPVPTDRRYGPQDGPTWGSITIRASQSGSVQKTFRNAIDALIEMLGNCGVLHQFPLADTHDAMIVQRLMPFVGCEGLCAVRDQALDEHQYALQKFRTEVAAVESHESASTSMTVNVQTDFKWSEDYTRVFWGDCDFKFITVNQSNVIRVLIEARKANNLPMFESTLCERAGIDGRIRDTFRLTSGPDKGKPHPALGLMIVRDGKQAWTLADPPGAGALQNHDVVRW